VIDGELHRMKAGDFVAFPSGTGICHTFINDGERDALLLSGGEADKSNNRIYYPLNPGRQSDMPWSCWWDDVPPAPRRALTAESRAEVTERADLRGRSSGARRHDADASCGPGCSRNQKQPCPTATAL